MTEKVTLVDTDIDSEKLAVELLDLIQQYKLDHLKQITVTTVDGENNFTQANGRFTELTDPEGAYNKVIRALSGTYMEQCINRYPDYYRWRLLKLTPTSTYTIHNDSSVPDMYYNFRLHIPIISNWMCFMMFFDNMPEADQVITTKWHQLKPGNSYITDTTLWHTAVNHGLTDRWHLVGVRYQEVDKKDK